MVGMIDEAIGKALAGATGMGGLPIGSKACILGGQGCLRLALL
jgi:hypothetical protein